jgi:hypothetical protein
MDLKERGYVLVSGVDSSEDGGQWWALVKRVLSFRLNTYLLTYVRS